MLYTCVDNQGERMSLTIKNLESALAGESQAHIKYRYFARLARAEGYEEVAAHFEHTADQELLHAWSHLELLVGKPSTRECLIQAIEGETEEFTYMYPRMATAALTALPGGDTHFNSLIVKQMLTGKETPIRDAVILNAALAIAAFKGDFALPLQTQIANALVLANRAIDSGAAVSALNRWIELSNTIAETR